MVADPFLVLEGERIVKRTISILMAIALGTLQGCGTIHNLSLEPEKGDYEDGPLFPKDDFHQDWRYAEPRNCEPFGGIASSIFMAKLGLSTGPVQGEIGHGGILMGTGSMLAGTVFLVVDTPLSFVGDLVTLPIAKARQQGVPWATWWGLQAPHHPRKTDFQLQDEHTPKSVTISGP